MVPRRTSIPRRITEVLTGNPTINAHSGLRHAEKFQERLLERGFSIGTLAVVDIEKDQTGRILDKSIRKDGAKVDRLKQFGIFSESLEIGDRCIIDTARGDRFTELADNSGESFFVKLRNAEVVKEPPKSISVVSGPCLFDVASATARIRHSGRLMSLMTPEFNFAGSFDNISIKDDITLYETESVERLGRCIGFFSRENSKIRDVSINLPRIEYYLNVCEAFRMESLINPEETLQFFDTVDARAKRISSLFARRITRYCDEKTQVRSSEPLKVLEPHIRSMVSCGFVPNLGEMIEILKKSSPTAYSILVRQPPQSFNDLSHIGYMLAELELVGVPAGNLVLAVENPPEEQILESILKRGKEHSEDHAGPRSQIIGIYPFPMVIPHETKRNSLYFLESQATLANLKKILAPYRRKNE